MFQYSGHISASFRQKFILNTKYTWSKINIFRRSENVEFFPLKGCEKIDILPEKYKETGGIPSLEELAMNLGYPIEKYIVQTEDRYLLTLFRMKHGKENLGGPAGKPVMLQHGLLDSAAAYLATPTGMAYYLADKGYDVWVGNSRGTTFSRSHMDADRNPNNKGTTFWEFSFHEMGVFDLPAVFKKIREVTGGNQRIHYVGMSMGTTQFMVMASEFPSYLAWIDCVVFMAPVARPIHMTAVSGVKYFFNWIFFYTLRGLTDGETCMHKAKLAEAVYKFCTTDGIRKNICKSIMKNFPKSRAGESIYDFENTVTTYLYSPAGSSVNTFLHYLQIVNSGKFQKFNYGKRKNKEIYKSKKPPEYNLKNIKKKLFLIVGGADEIADEVDVLWLQKELPSSEIITENFELFTHRDFHFSVNIQGTLYDKILEIFADWESNAENFKK